MDLHQQPWWTPIGFFGVMVLLLTFGLGTIRPNNNPYANQDRLQAFDSERKILFSADPANGNIHVLNLYHNVSNIANLHLPERTNIYDIRLTLGGKSLWVLANNGIYRYDTRTLKEIDFQPRHFVTPHHFAQVSEQAVILQ